MRDLDKFRGCMIGGAAGDALGYAIEFIHEKQIFSRYGKDGITQYALRGGVAQFSDDTQMTLFTAVGLLNEDARAQTSGTQPDYTQAIKRAYQDWYITQAGTYPVSNKKTSWLLGVPGFFSRRAPGLTCISAIEHGADGSIEAPINTSKGCGGVMRVAPIGLYFAGTDVNILESDMLGAKAAAITHGHELGYIPAAALVHILRAVCEDSEKSLTSAVTESVDAMKQLFPTAKHIGCFTDIMSKAVELANSDCKTVDAIHQLGEGWVAEEALAISVYSALKYEDDFDMALRTSVNHNGDSDSTGSLTGNILGAYMGCEAIPLKYKDELELIGLITEVTDDLFGECDEAAWVSKYVDVTYEYKC